MLLSLLISITSCVSAVAIHRNVSASPLEVTLLKTGNTEVKASTLNAKSNPIKLLNKGTLLDFTPVNKVDVRKANLLVPFVGIFLNLRSSLDEDAFTTIKAKQSIEVTFDIAQTHNLQAGGAREIIAEGAIGYAELNSTQIEGAYPYKSNILTMAIDGNKLMRTNLALNRIYERAQITSNCTGAKQVALNNSLAWCAKLAAQASMAALNGSAAKFKEYFHSDDQSARADVSKRYQVYATECAAGNSGKATITCTDKGRWCNSNVVAYADVNRTQMVPCDYYFNSEPVKASRCRQQDQGVVTLHEFTHLPGLYSPPTQDYGYSPSELNALPSAKALLNAETYAFYASGKFVKEY